jgi:Cytochrome c oxidase subunit IV
VKVQAWIFGSLTIFMLIVTPIYWFITADDNGVPEITGTVALILTFFLVFIGAVLRSDKLPPSRSRPPSGIWPPTLGRCPTGWRGGPIRWTVVLPAIRSPKTRDGRFQPLHLTSMPSKPDWQHLPHRSH